MSLLRRLERTGCIAAVQTQSSYTLKQLDLECVQAAYLGVRPECVDARERLAAEQRQRALERCLLLFSCSSLAFTAEAIQVVEINSNLLAIECVRVAVALEGAAEQFPRLAYGLVEAASAAAGIVAGPKRFQNLITACRAPSHCEVCDQLRRRLSPRLFLLAASQLEWPEKENSKALVARVSRCDFDGQRRLARAVPLKMRCCRPVFSAFATSGKAEDRWCERRRVCPPVACPVE